MNVLDSIVYFISFELLAFRLLNVQTLVHDLKRTLLADGFVSIYTNPSGRPLSSSHHLMRVLPSVSVELSVGRAVVRCASRHAVVASHSILYDGA